MHIIALYVIDVIMVVSFILELWTGCAIAGWDGNNPIVQRESSPKKYWLVIAIHASILVAAVALVVGAE